MEYLGVSYEARHLPKLDPQFIPFGAWVEAYQKGRNSRWRLQWSGIRAIFLCTIRRSTARRKWPRPIIAMSSAM